MTKVKRLGALRVGLFSFKMKEQEPTGKNMKQAFDCSALVKPGTYRGKSANGKGDDRVGYRALEGFGTFYLADGATGIGMGAEAADAFVAALEDADYDLYTSAESCCDLLRLADEEVSVKLKGNGDTTGILIVTNGEDLWGASAGDSRGMLYKADGVVELTGRQVRKPRFGSGATPVGFKGRVKSGERLLLASDGLWDFAQLGLIGEIARGPGSADEIVHKLEQLVRSQNEDRLPDDLSIMMFIFRR
jgi:serine/threonine protein phosphatase PrpC